MSDITIHHLRTAHYYIDPVRSEQKKNERIAIRNTQTAIDRFFYLNFGLSPIGK